MMSSFPALQGPYVENWKKNRLYLPTFILNKVCLLIIGMKFAKPYLMVVFHFICYNMLHLYVRYYIKYMKHKIYAKMGDFCYLFFLLPPQIRCSIQTHHHLKTQIITSIGRILSHNLRFNSLLRVYLPYYPSLVSFLHRCWTRRPMTIAISKHGSFLLSQRWHFLHWT